MAPCSTADLRPEAREKHAVRQAHCSLTFLVQPCVGLHMVLLELSLKQGSLHYLNMKAAFFTWQVTLSLMLTLWFGTIPSATASHRTWWILCLEFWNVSSEMWGSSSVNPLCNSYFHSRYIQRQKPTTPSLKTYFSISTRTTQEKSQEVAYLFQSRFQEYQSET